MQQLDKKCEELFHRTVGFMQSQAFRIRMTSGHFLTFTHFLSLYKVGTVQFTISNSPDRMFTNFQSITYLVISGKLRRLPREEFNIPSMRITTPFAYFLSLNCSSIQLLNHRLTNRQVNSWIRHWKQNETNISP